MKALALLSGGLDSSLAIKVILRQGIDIIAVNFTTPFCLDNKKDGCNYEARRVSEELGIELKVIALSWEYIEVVKKPKHGYGKNLNPCIDCRILMFRCAKKLMRELGASFVITGEVLGQRPMSQHKRALELIEREGGLQGLILRPLSAKLLPISIPEKEGWVQRARLLEISGRSRKPQMAKALDYEIGDYPSPAGGCLLTDFGFTQRLKDLLRYCEITLNDIELLKIGRHFRISPQTKIIVGRDKQENERLLTLIQRGDICFNPTEVPGPIGVGRGKFNQATISLASQIIARYSDHDQSRKVRLKVNEHPDGKEDYIIVDRIADNQLEVLRI